ncbi:Oidioi.mRNA.OKI2018_I69.XSR.g15340.t2.cds [Oikopleura dioica]|uniref:Oidioi.mRNA.OKI2018_I69.XSR.g15340.t2.cds n=1 Tax=Oikopleura dioica TaxID=34765 RepID=A0ABN7SCK5_OIKDI|nr:Oidioi.mRNA.OKI2018_I69.XSR.g15340.t2.cds [Oikopleura dioica]
MRRLSPRKHSFVENSTLQNYEMPKKSSLLDVIRHENGGFQSPVPKMKLSSVSQHGYLMVGDSSSDSEEERKISRGVSETSENRTETLAFDNQNLTSFSLEEINERPNGAQNGSNGCSRLPRQQRKTALGIPSKLQHLADSMSNNSDEELTENIEKQSESRPLLKNKRPSIDGSLDGRAQKSGNARRQFQSFDDRRMSTFQDQRQRTKKQPKRIFSIQSDQDQQSDENEEDKIDGEVFVIELDDRGSRAPKLHTRPAWQRGVAGIKAVVQNPKITKHETIDENSAVPPTSNRDSTVERPSIKPLLVKANGDAGVTNQGNRSRELWQLAFRKITEGVLRRDSDEKETSLKPDPKPALKKQSTQDTTKSARTSKSDMSEFENPRSIIPTKGEKVELEKLEGFDLKYTSGRRFCGMYTPTMSTAFDPKSAEDLYQRYVFRERLGSVLTIAIIELIMRVISIGLIIGIAGRWEHVSCWLLALTSLLERGHSFLFYFIRR